MKLLDDIKLVFVKKDENEVPLNPDSKTFPLTKRILNSLQDTVLEVILREKQGKKLPVSSTKLIKQLFNSISILFDIQYDINFRNIEKISSQAFLKRVEEDPNWIHSGQHEWSDGTGDTIRLDHQDMDSWNKAIVFHKLYASSRFSSELEFYLYLMSL